MQEKIVTLNKEEQKERVIAVGLICRSFSEEESSSEESLRELCELITTAGGEPIATILQTRGEPDARTFIGEGKAEEIAEFAENNDADLICFDNELSPSQAEALEQVTGKRILDRSGLILDIFAGRASSAEGKLQVELAQYKYLYPRLTGMWGHLVRQTASGGKSPIGTRGPGETQLETDRRHIRIHIQKLEEQLEHVRATRSLQRRRREKNEIPVIALVGYTNAGKSTLLNLLTGSDIPANNRLFDTLDTTTRKFQPADGVNCLLSDTVGFIRRLPTHLIEAFKATLEELCYADLILHVIDAADPSRELQARVTDRLIYELAGEEVPEIRVYNKADLLGTEDRPLDGILVSARTGEGIEHLKEEILSSLQIATRRVKVLLPYARGDIENFLRHEAAIHSLEYGEDGILMEVTVKENYWGRIRDYVLE